MDYYNIDVCALVNFNPQKYLFFTVLIMSKMTVLIFNYYNSLKQKHKQKIQ